RLNAPASIAATTVTADLLNTGCVADNHPRGQGQTESLAAETAIFAAEVPEDAARPVLPRQSPLHKTNQSDMHNGDAADQGANLALQADPPIAFTFVSVDDTCVHLEGTFRCTAAADGFATFSVRSESDYSDALTPARVRVVGRDADSEDVRVLPAG